MLTRTTVVGLVLVALASCAREPGAGASPSGVRGRVIRTPTCPVETEASPCPPESVAATVVIEGEAGRVRRVETRPDGTFRVGLPPGRYLVRAAPPAGSALVPVPQPVTVEAGSMAHVTLILDTRIRSA